jgi:hypothetical protein
MLSAFGEDVLSGFRNRFARYFGTDHMLLVGWQSYLSSLKPKPDDDTRGRIRPIRILLISFYNGAMSMFESMMEVCGSGDIEQALQRIKDTGDPGKLWEEYRPCLADDIDAEILDQYKKAFYGGTWFITATFMALANAENEEYFVRGMAALVDEINEFRTDMKQELIRINGGVDPREAAAKDSRNTPPPLPEEYLRKFAPKVFPAPPEGEDDLPPVLPPSSEWRRKQVTGRDVGVVIVLAMAVPVILSALGPFYYGYTNSPYWRVIVWALACTVGFLWLARASFKHTWDTEPRSVIGKLWVVAMIVIVSAVCFVVGDSAAYLLARTISN